MMHFARLARDLCTPQGIHPAGASVVVLSVSNERARICLDFGIHLSGRCHQATVPREMLDGAQTRRQTIMQTGKAA